MNCTHIWNFVSKEGNICLFFGLFACKHTYKNVRTFLLFLSIHCTVHWSMKFVFWICMTTRWIIMWCSQGQHACTRKKRNSIVLRAFAQTHRHIHLNSSNAKTILIRTVRCIVRKNAHYFALCPSLHVAAMRAYFCILLATFATIYLLFCVACRFWSFIFERKKKRNKKCPLSKGWLIFRIFKEKEWKDVLALMSYKMHSNETALVIYWTIGAAAYGTKSMKMCIVVCSWKSLYAKWKKSSSKINAKQLKPARFYDPTNGLHRVYYWPGLKWKTHGHLIVIERCENIKNATVIQWCSKPDYSFLNKPQNAWKYRRK